MTWRNDVEWPADWTARYKLHKPATLKWKTEAALCEAFAEAVPKGWTVYPETCGFDMVVVHTTTGTQIGVEAKLTLNAKVIEQVIKGERWYRAGPDYRAVLVGRVSGEMLWIANRMGITVIMPSFDPRQSGCYGIGRGFGRLGPSLPSIRINDMPERENDWRDDAPWGYRAPIERLTLPEYVPQVAAGVPAPQTLSRWKIQAIKMCLHVEAVGVVSRADFKALALDPGRWMNGHWLQKSSTRGFWIAGPRFPAQAFQGQHPGSWDEISQDRANWKERAALEAVTRPDVPVEPLPDQEAML